jgi:AmmeMemoRadiSam system protein B
MFMSAFREPTVAGIFYPTDARELSEMISVFLSESKSSGPTPKALILPHAGYIYSGPVAASGYRRLINARHRIKRVVLIGPSHFVDFDGLAASRAEAFATPLGDVPLDRSAMAEALRLPQVELFERAHAREHSLEVHLPFLQTILDEFFLIPLAVGDAAPAHVGEVLDALWGGEETVVIVSSDLSHYHTYETARRLDEETSSAIEKLEPIGHPQACGHVPINGLLYLAARRGLKVKTVDLRNSGDTAGPRDSVVGYGSYVFEE